MTVFRSPLHDERVAARLGLVLAVTFSTCFLTGLYSHLAQHPSFGFELPARPAGLYRVTQGVHVITGIASIPLLLAKLWTVYPNLFRWPPFRSFSHAIERLCVIPLVAGSIFLLFTGLANIHLWYPWFFFFPTMHFWTAWIVIGALVVHAGAKLPATRTALRRAPAGAASDPVDAALDRRRFLATVFGTGALMAAFTVGQTFRPLARLALLSPRRPDAGPQGFPVNKTASEAGVTAAVHAPEYRVEVVGNVARVLSLTVDQLRAMPQRSATLPIACVEGWSASRHWTGVPVRALLTAAGAPHHASVRVESIERAGLYSTSQLDPQQARDADTLLALEVDGAPLTPDHGYPVRLIGPDRPGVMQTKWVRRLVVS